MQDAVEFTYRIIKSAESKLFADFFCVPFHYKQRGWIKNMLVNCELRSSLRAILTLRSLRTLRFFLSESHFHPPTACKIVAKIISIGYPFRRTVA